MSEKQFWALLKKNLEHRLRMDRHTDRIRSDVPDIHFLSKRNGLAGWIELKYKDKWTHGQSMGLRPQQIAFLEGYTRDGGVGIVLLKVGKSHIYAWDRGFRLIQGIPQMASLPKHFRCGRFSGSWPDALADWIDDHQPIIRPRRVKAGLRFTPSRDFSFGSEQD